jgi:hypothetical protein
MKKLFIIGTIIVGILFATDYPRPGIWMKRVFLDTLVDSIYLQIPGGWLGIGSLNSSSTPSGENPLWQADANGNLMPTTNGANDSFWEYDGSGDLMPKS